MAARLLAPVTAVLVLVALSHVPASAPATLPDLPSELGAATTSSELGAAATSSALGAATSSELGAANPTPTSTSTSTSKSSSTATSTSTSKSTSTSTSTSKSTSTSTSTSKSNSTSTSTSNSTTSGHSGSSSSYKLPTSGHEQDAKKKQEEEESEEKKQQRQKETEKRRQEEKEMEKECRAFAKEHNMVSPTNFTGSYKGMRLDFIHGHNAIRQRYGVPAVRWDKKMAKHARRWANTMRKHCELKHSITRYGESVYKNPNFWNATAKDAIASWSSEEPFYDKSTEGCTAGHSSGDCGHFRLMVGKRFQRVGCARAECFKGGVFICCNYWTFDLKDLD